MTVIRKLILAYESKDYSKLTKVDLFELVKKGILHQETADRLLKETSNVS